MDQRNDDIAELALFKHVANASPDFIGICDAELVPVFVNPAGLRLVELKFHEARDLSVPDYFVDEERDFVSEHVLPTAMSDGEWAGELHLKKFKSGGRTPILYSVFRVDHPITGRPAYLATISRDLTRQKADEERKSLLMSELDHRVKNLLAIIQSIASHTFRSQRNVQGSLDVFLGRLKALANSHETLGSGEGESADLHQLVDSAFRGAGVSKSRYQADGEVVSLSPRLSQTLIMALHELCTNAMKYGALSNDGGLICLNWIRNKEGEDTLTITWQEKHGPRIAKPTQFGFGSQLITSTVKAHRDGSVDFEYDRSGLKCAIRVALD